MVEQVETQLRVVEPTEEEVLVIKKQRKMHSVAVVEYG
jgi:hypothetical protein